MDTYDINFTLNYSISKRTQDKDLRPISVPVSCNNHNFLYHLESESLEGLIEQLKQKITQVEDLWITGKIQQTTE